MGGVKRLAEKVSCTKIRLDGGINTNYCAFEHPNFVWFGRGKVMVNGFSNLKRKGCNSAVVAVTEQYDIIFVVDDLRFRFD